jgi:ribosomal protein L37AE/L43A
MRGGHSMKATPAQQLIAQHEAGMHDRRQREDCRACRKEQEANTVAKQLTQCAICAGSYDGTPSGEKKHNATAKHVNAAAEARALVAAAEPSKPVGTPAEQAKAVPVLVASGAPQTAKQVAVGIATRRRDENVAHLEWRKKHGPASQVGKYEALVDDWNAVLAALR